MALEVFPEPIVPVIKLFWYNPEQERYCFEEETSSQPIKSLGSLIDESFLEEDFFLSSKKEKNEKCFKFFRIEINFWKKCT